MVSYSVQLDILGVKVVRPARGNHGTGAAFLAGPETGFWKDEEDIKNIWSVGKNFCRNEEERDMPCISTEKGG